MTTYSCSLSCATFDLGKFKFYNAPWITTITSFKIKKLINKIITHNTSYTFAYIPQYNCRKESFFKDSKRQ